MQKSMFSCLRILFCILQVFQHSLCLFLHEPQTSIALRELKGENFFSWLGH